MCKKQKAIDMCARIQMIIIKFLLSVINIVSFEMLLKMKLLHSPMVSIDRMPLKVMVRQ